MKHKHYQDLLEEAILHAQTNSNGQPASYIPELANVDLEKTGVALKLINGEDYSAGNCQNHYFTLQSTAKVIILIALLEEYGQDQVFQWINVEPSGQSFGAIDYNRRFTDLPSNPMINAGAITLISHAPGRNIKQQSAWLSQWMETLCDAKLNINDKVLHSELDNADRNRALAYLLRSQGIITGNVEAIIELYTTLCSFESTIMQAAHLPMLLSNRGLDQTGKRVLKRETVTAVVSILATCGLYNETGFYLLRTGMPAKSGVSGLIIACGIAHGGIAVFSPRITPKGGSVRGQMMLEFLAKELGWHFANTDQSNKATSPCASDQ
jgi:glutaminase